MVDIHKLPNQGTDNMDPLKRQALYNAFKLVASLNPREKIVREELIDALRRPVPPAAERESDAVIRHAYRHYIINADVDNAERIVSYFEASVLTNKSVEALRAAAYRGTLAKVTEFRDGRDRVGVTLRSLADWCNWDQRYFEESGRLLDSIREVRDET